MGKSEFIVLDSCALINKSNWTNCKYVCKLFDGALVSECPTNQNPREPETNLQAQLYIEGLIT